MDVSLISNPPYNLRWKHPDLAGFMSRYMGKELPPESNANYAFILSGFEWSNDRAVFLLPNGVLSSGIKQELNLRKQFVHENILRAVISLPGNMFESTNIPTCILVFDKNKTTQRIALIDLTEYCIEEVRDQRGQYGGASHVERVYHKTIKIIPEDIISKCFDVIEKMIDEDGFCVCVSPERIKDNDYNLVPKRYFDIKYETGHRDYKDIADDYNRIIRQKNTIKICMNKTAAKRLGYDCLNQKEIDLTDSFAVVGQKAEKDNYITFSANDGIKIMISTKDDIHPLIIDFLGRWKQMIMYLNNEENRLLAEFRDALLPDLMSGKIVLEEEEEMTK